MSLLRDRWTKTRVLVPKVKDAPHKVKQEFRDEVNINSIMRKMRAGIAPPAWMTSKTPMYGDFSKMPNNAQDAFSFVDRAKESFYALPVEFRHELGHDPRNLVNAPRELFEKYGLTNKASEASSAPLGASGAQKHPEGSGDRGLPSKAPSGANKKADKAAPPVEPEE